MLFEKLKANRIERGITCKQMAELIGLKTRGAYFKKEQATVPFRLDEARKIADFFNKAIDDIFFDNKVSLKGTKVIKQKRGETKWTT